MQTVLSRVFVVRFIGANVRNRLRRPLRTYIVIALGNVAHGLMRNMFTGDGNTPGTPRHPYPPLPVPFFHGRQTLVTHVNQDIYLSQQPLSRMEQGVG